MSFDLTQFDLFGFVKIAILILLVLYAIFAFVLIVQVKNMNKIIHHTTISTIIFGISLIHLVLVLLLFLLALFIL